MPATTSPIVYKPEYRWLQVTEHSSERCLPWKCVDCRNGVIHTFKTVDDARTYAESEGIRFYL